MSTNNAALTGLRFLRPYLCPELQVVRKSAYIRFFNTSCARRGVKRTFKDDNHYKQGAVEFRNEVKTRAEELKTANALKWPRIESSLKAMTCREFLEKYSYLKNGENLANENVVIRGRLRSFRVAGKGLAFLDLVQDGHKVQVVFNLAQLSIGGLSAQRFRAFYHLIQRGDILSAQGSPCVTTTGECSVTASDLPVILSPSLASLPRVLGDRETRMRNRHVDLLVNPEPADTIRARSHIIQYIRDFLIKDQFLEVQTPLIVDKAGGAVARPFTTIATEFSQKQLALRIAPEIWLKRLVIGGLDRVFEIGPAFRNEGLDATHNPEFTTCEFYKAFADLQDLMTMTESMISGISTQIEDLRTNLSTLPKPDESFSSTPYKRLRFIPSIEKALGEALPDLAAADATEHLVSLFEKHALTVPTSPTLPRLLDRLAAIYIEPHCVAPTFIIEHPACMAPLAKSFLCPQTKQQVSARAELFVQNHEIANMYEEENSPITQREKFLEQIKFKDDENEGHIDESYLEALEWGLPPTGGWGAGIDRIIMLFTGAKRISDVLAFGNLRNVVNLGSPNLTKKVDEKAREE